MPSKTQKKNSFARNMFCIYRNIFLAFCLFFSFSVALVSPESAYSKTTKSSKKKTTKKSTRKKSTRRKSTRRRSSRSRSRRRSSRSRRSRSRRSRSSRRTKPKPKPLTKAQLAAKKKKQATMSNLNSAMVLYDSAIVSKEKGDYKTAKARLTQAIAKIGNSRSYQKSGNEGTTAALAYYQLGLIAELDRDFLTAKDSYAKCLRIRPRHTQASVRLVNILAKYGHIDLARVKAMDAVKNNPKDPRAHLLLSLLSKHKGETQLAEKEAKEMTRLLSVDAQIIPKNNAKQKSVIRMVDFLNKPKPKVEPKASPVTKVKPHDEVVEDDAIEENPADAQIPTKPKVQVNLEDKTSAPSNQTSTTQPLESGLEPKPEAKTETKADPEGSKTPEAPVNPSKQ